jgi:gamma-glutamyltranspeptidase/glutathione hydrolase
MPNDLTRRDLLHLGGTALGIRAIGHGSEAPPTRTAQGTVVGEPAGAQAGKEMLAAGGNVVDAIVSAALTSGVVAVPSCGIGGYGGHMTIAFAESGEVTSIDFNSTAPKGLRKNSFSPDADGKVPGRINQFGWLAAGVPGTLAGMQLALDRCGTRSFAEAVRPAIKFAREGFEVSEGLASAIRNASERLLQDPGSRRLFLRNGEPLPAGETYRNPNLADMLETLAERNSAESFYRGDIAERIVAAFQTYGGLATIGDFADHHAREVKPLRLEWQGDTIHTAPLTAGGTTVIEILSILRALEWTAIADPVRRCHARLEAMRIAWNDRLRLLGDPAHADVPVERLLSDAYAEQMARRVRRAMEQQRPVEIETDWLEQVGTIHLSAVDGSGNMAALTLTHGGSFGSRVTVDGLGLILGHGMSRFDPRPGKANSPGPGKRPLHNMCPTVVFRAGKPVLAVGARGGRRIPNCVLGILLNFCGLKRSLQESVSAPRMQTEGGMRLQLDDPWSEQPIAFLGKLGYEIVRGPVAVASAVAADPSTGQFVAAEH